jgi:hypothetical protein
MYILKVNTYTYSVATLRRSAGQHVVSVAGN